MTETLVRAAGPFTPQPRSDIGSIFTVAEIREGMPWVDSVDMIESYNCVTVQHLPLANCAAMSAGFTKTFGSPGWPDGIRFVVQGGVQCKPFGFNANDSRLAASFAVQEANGVAEALRDGTLGAGTDYTPTGGSVTPVQGLGILESIGRCKYAGEPVIHMGALMAAELTGVNALNRVGNRLETSLGTPVAVSCGYETQNGGKFDTDQWGYVTGAVVIARSEMVNEAQLDQTTNQWTALFERLYLVAVDCVAAKVKVKVL